MHLSVLDQSPVPKGSTPAEALKDTVALAQLTERLGYRRFWLAEHHNTASLAGTAPEVMAAHVAGHTSSIRVGAGGVLLSHYSPLKVAEVFSVLNALFPGRIDLGLGRTAGADGSAAAALSGSACADDDDYPARVADVAGFVHDRLARDHPFASVRANPRGPGAPEIWVLGSSSYGTELAAGLGLPFSFAHFVSPDFGPQMMAGYRRRFRPSPVCRVPKASVGVSVVCAATDAEAERLALSQDVWHLRPEGGERGPLMAPEEAEACRLSDVDQVRLQQRRHRRIAGAPDRVRAELLDLARSYQTDELVVLTVCHDPQARMRSYELLAEVFAEARR